jgi:hypothetical protein
MSDMGMAVTDIRYLLERGYPKKGAITYVCNHYRLDVTIRHIITRVVHSHEKALNRRAKTVSCDKMAGNEVWIDGYNVLIGVESALKGEPIYLCDDMFIRDIRGIFRNYQCSTLTGRALEEILRVLAICAPAKVEFLFDSQISKSGELAQWTANKMNKFELAGCARTSKHVDFELKNCNKMVATSDGSIIDAVREVVNIQGYVLDQLQLRPRMIEGLIR